MRVIVVGAGKVGLEIVHQLSNAKRTEVVVIERDEQRAESLAAELDALVLHGDGTHPDILEQARVRAADAVVAATSDDATNLVISMLVKRYGIETVVVRMEDLALRPAAEELGVSEIVSAKLSAAGAIMQALRGEHHVDFAVVSRGGIDLVELPGDELAGKKVRDCDMGRHTLLVAVRRSPEEALLAKPDLEIEKGDTLLFMVDDDRALDELVDELRSHVDEEGSSP